MAKKFELPQNVLQVIDKASTAVGKFHDENFNINVWNECIELGMESPIEQILYTAFEAVRELNCYEKDEPDEIDGQSYILGLGLIPQYKLNKYRADFLGVYGKKRMVGGVFTKEVIVECDSQQFHERTEKERRYEKARDRFFQIQGYKIFRFTGKEIIENPFKVACEIIGYLTDQDADELYTGCKEFM